MPLINTKLSQLPQDSSPASTDFLVGINGTPQDSKYAISDLSGLYIPVKFSAYRNAAANTGNGAFAIVNFDTKVLDTGSNFDVITHVGRFTAPFPGSYQFSARVGTSQSSGGHRLIASLFKNGSEVSRGSDASGVGATLFFNGSVVSDLLELNTSDYVEVWCYGDTSLTLDVSTSAYQRFSGFLVSKN